MLNIFKTNLSYSAQNKRKVKKNNKTLFIHLENSLDI